MEVRNVNKTWMDDRGRGSFGQNIIHLVGHVVFDAVRLPGRKAVRQVDLWVYILRDRLTLKSTPKSWQTDKFNNKICFQFLLLNIGSSADKPSSTSVQQTFIGNIFCGHHSARHWDHQD